MTRALYAVGRFCTRFRWPVIAAWVVVAAILVGLAHHAGEDTNDNLKLPGTDSDRTTQTLADRFPSHANGTIPLVLHARSGTLRDSRYAEAISQTTKAYASSPDVTAAVSPLSQQGRGFLDKDAKTGYVSLALNQSPSDLSTDEAEDLFALADPARQAGLQVEAGGYLGQKLSKPSTESSEAVGLSMAVIVLLVTFGTVVAMGLPIVTAVVGLASALSLITLLEHVAEVPRTAPTLATMLGLGVGIDYSLFLVSRHREQVRSGLSYEESVARAVATDGAAVIFAGTTVVIAICSLAIADIPLVSLLGFSSAIAVLTAVVAAVTLLPAILAVLGQRLESLRLPGHRRGPVDPRGSIWYRIGQKVTSHPLASVVLALAILVPLALPTATLTLGQQDVGSLASSTTARRAYDLMKGSFGQGANGPLLVAVELRQPASGPGDARLAKLESAISSQPDVASVSPVSLNADRSVAVFTAIARSAPSDTSTSELVKHLRSDTIPSALPAGTGSAFVGGTTASYVDLATQIGKKLPLLIAIVIVLSFVVLMIAFHSLLIPFKAALMNLVSVAAAYGVLTAIFEKGWGVTLIGLQHSVPVVSFVPLMMFAVLFGLSMDYEVFLMNHVQEAYKRTNDNTEAVLEGLATSGGVISSAALIMVSVFASFVLNGDPTVKQFGVGLAVAIALDATIVRCLLVPALMVLAHNANWWFPRWLERSLPQLNLEGAEFFAARDEGAPAASRSVTARPSAIDPDPEPSPEPEDRALSELAVLQTGAEADGRRCVAGALILDGEGRVLVQRRGRNRRLLPGCWDIVGGHLEPGETLLGALAREVAEETGWTLSGVPTLAYVADWEAGDEGEVSGRREFDFVVGVAGDLSRPRLERPKQVEFRWVDADDLELLSENRGADGGLVRRLVELALRYAHPGRLTSPHATAFLDPAVAGPIEEIRAAWDPAMAAQIATHVTVLYPEEIGDLDELGARLSAAAAAVSPFRLQVGTVDRDDVAGGWVFVEADDLDGGWEQLRRLVLGPAGRAAARPHVTLVHPRTTNRGEAAWTALAGRSFDLGFTVRELSLTAFDGRRWQTVGRVALGA